MQFRRFIFSASFLLACGSQKDSGLDGPLVDLTDTASSTEHDADTDSDSDGDSDADSDADGDSDTDSDTDTDADIDRDRDNDGDGYTINEGDCDDSDSNAHPGMSLDACDGVDNDCDGIADEDFSDDEHEPNDVSATDLGELSDYEDESVAVEGYISPSYDVDVFSFFVDDGWFDWFEVEIDLSDVPGDADLALELVWVSDSDGEAHGTVAETNEASFGGDERLTYNSGLSGIWSDTSGTYEIVVYSMAGHGCEAPYSLYIKEGGLFVGINVAGD
jgi:hypothetical protein